MAGGIEGPFVLCDAQGIEEVFFGEGHDRHVGCMAEDATDDHGVAGGVGPFCTGFGFHGEVQREFYPVVRAIHGIFAVVASIGKLITIEARAHLEEVLDGELLLVVIVVFERDIFREKWSDLLVDVFNKAVVDGNADEEAGDGFER